MSGNAASNGQMVRTTMAIPIDIGGGQTARINLPPGATLAGPVKVLTLPNQQTIAHVTVMAPPGVVEKYVAQAAAESEKKENSTACTKDNNEVVSNGQKKSPPAPIEEKPASTPSNLFDKINKSKKPQDSLEELETKPEEKVKKSPSDDNIPLARLSKKIENTSSSKGSKEKRPQTGFGSYLAEHKSKLLLNFPNISEKQATAEVKRMWENLDNSTKNHYIRNSDAYKLKKGLSLDQPVTKKTSSKPSKPKDAVHSDTMAGGYPKRNVKRRMVDVSEDELDPGDSDWTIPESITCESKTKLNSALPTLKFKKKSKTLSSEGYTSPKPSKKSNEEEDLPFVFEEEKPEVTQPPPPIEKKNNKIPKPSDLSFKESTPPPPLTKKEPTVTNNHPEKRSTFKAMCLQDGCFEEVQISDERGKYWCSDKCCVQYAKIIFNAWITARKANMID